MSLQKAQYALAIALAGNGFEAEVITPPLNNTYLKFLDGRTYLPDSAQSWSDTHRYLTHELTKIDRQAGPATASPDPAAKLWLEGAKARYTGDPNPTLLNEGLGVTSIRYSPSGGARSGLIQLKTVKHSGIGPAIANWLAAKLSQTAEVAELPYQAVPDGALNYALGYISCPVLVKEGTLTLPGVEATLEITEHPIELIYRVEQKLKDAGVYSGNSRQVETLSTIV